MRYHVSLGGRDLAVDLHADAVEIDGRRHEVDLRSLAAGDVYTLVVDGRAHRVIAESEGEGSWRLVVDGVPFEAEAIDERTRAIRELAGAGAGASGPRPLRAPMPGLLVKVEVREGDLVRPGDGLVIVEAMKMENELRASVEARVGRVLVEAGQAVEKDQILIELEAPDSAQEDGA